MIIKYLINFSLIHLNIFKSWFYLFIYLFIYLSFYLFLSHVVFIVMAVTWKIVVDANWGLWRTSFTPKETKGIKYFVVTKYIFKSVSSHIVYQTTVEN